MDERRGDEDARAKVPDREEEAAWQAEAGEACGEHGEGAGEGGDEEDNEDGADVEGGVVEGGVRGVLGTGGGAFAELCCLIGLHFSQLYRGTDRIRLRREACGRRSHRGFSEIDIVVPAAGDGGEEDGGHDHGEAPGQPAPPRRGRGRS